MKDSRVASIDVDAERPRTTFDDVAGVDEAKHELREVVDFLKTPARYTAHACAGYAARRPARHGQDAAGSSGRRRSWRALFGISGSAFVEMFVRVGASRLRDLFEQAKTTAPSVIFIDEIDAAGSRTGRIDRQVTVAAPDIRGREAVLHVHARVKPMDGGVDLGALARFTPGLSGADLANVLNEATILAARRQAATIADLVSKKRSTAW